jgi:hypothetical protein
MKTACKAITCVLLFYCLIFIPKLANAQAKFAVGGGGALSYSKENIPGFGVVSQGEIRLDKFVSITPSVGVEVPYLVYAGLAVRFYINPKLYVHAGGFVNAEGDGFYETGGGATGGLGYMVFVKPHQTIDLNFHADFKNNNDKNLAIYGIRLIYSYSFTKLVE